MSVSKWRVVWVVLGFVSGSTAWGQAISIVNPGFEANVITPGTFQVFVPTGWTMYDPGAIINQNQNAVGVIRPLPGVEYFPGGTPEGVNGALVFLAGNQASEAGLQQTLTTSFLNNTRYTLTVQIGNIASGTSLPGSADGGGVFYNLNGFPGYRIDLMAGTTVLASDNNTIGATIPEGEFRLSTLVFQSGAIHPQAGQLLGIRLVNLHTPGTGSAPNIEVDFDQVSLTAVAVPEPVTWALCGMSGAAGVGIVWMRKRQATRAMEAVLE
ncbi:MAG: hypothetical protein QM703_16325 [Gemmatales bacterium]